MTKTTKQILSIQPANGLYAKFHTRSTTQPVQTEQVQAFVYFQQQGDSMVHIAPVFTGDLENGYVMLNTDEDRIELVTEPIVYPERDPSDIEGMLEDSRI